VAVRVKLGAMLAGRYRLLEQLGEGGMGSVWKAEHVLLHSHVAIKIIDPEVARLEFNLARFLREAKTLATLRSPNVVQVLDFGSDSDTPYLVMELLQGQTLGRRVADKGRLSLSETSGVLEDVCTAMALVHEQGLIHRDLKPENIFLCNTGGQRVTKVVDFGIAKSLRGDMSASMQTRTGHMLGTPSYMSPEQCRGLKDIDHRADLWALGVITYECLVGKVPFEGEVLGDLLLRICMDPLPIPSERAKGLPDEFDAWFAKAVARDRSVRFQSALELSKALSELTASGAVGSTPPARESSEPSRPSFARLVAPMATPRQPSNTETNTTVGLGGGAGRRVDRRTRALAAAGVVACAAAGLWAIGNKREAGGPVGVDVRSLRAPFAVTPKVIRAGVPSGRRRQAAPSAAGAFTLEAAHGVEAAHDFEAPPAAAAVSEVTARGANGFGSGGAAPRAPAERAPAERAPAEHGPPGAGLTAAGSFADSQPWPGAAGTSAPSAGSAGASGSNAAAAPHGAPARPVAPPRALRGTAATNSTPSRSSDLPPIDIGIRRTR
jgi:eukaryotic-like serine/threonine-protein kinase